MKRELLQPDIVDVHLQSADADRHVRVGKLAHRHARGHTTLSFSYTSEWLNSRRSFMLDPRLELYAGEQYAAGAQGNFGIFLDSAPDRWGRMLLDRREAEAARSEHRAARALTEWDYLLGVQDECRMGALRFRHDAASPFLDNQPLPVPPVTSLPELESISLALEQDHAEDLPNYRQWLLTLIAPGTSLGGSRPKANFLEKDGSLWIAKFPSREDRRDIGAWEKLLLDLAASCGIVVSEHSRHRFHGKHHTFCTKRFDRHGPGRSFFVSAMTLLERRDGDGGSYLDLAEFIQTHGVRGHIEADLEQLFRRVIFNVLVGNTDDHLRNHGFIHENEGWRLAPAYDLNPNPAKRAHALRIDESTTAPDIDVVMATASLYRLPTPKAAKLLEAVRSKTRKWKELARNAQLSSTEIASSEAAFALSA